MPLLSGQVLNNRYRIVRLLGQGGFGAVYRAWDTNINRPCAVKENLDISPEAQRQFTREATVLANLSHTNLPRVTDHFILPDQGQYLVMDFVEGEDLASMVKRQGVIPVEQALDWLLQVADALAYLHNRQPPVVHRDVKPANIRITPDGRAMLVDFGLVKLYDPHLHTTLGARAVTPGYAPPEQYGQGKTDARTDQYALAATLYNLLTAHEPMESVQRMAGGQMRPVHQINPRINPTLGMAIERAMRLEPNQRFAGMAEFKAALSAPAAPGIVARQSPDVYVRPMTPAPASSVVSGAAAVNPPRPERTAYPPAARPARGGRTRTAGIGISVAVIAAVCIGLALLLGLMANNANRNGEKTADAEIQATLAERVRVTSTAQVLATQTAEASTATAEAQLTAEGIAQVTANAKATADAIDALYDSFVADKTIVYGPADGSLAHEPSDNKVELYDPEVDLVDFVVEARLHNPYSTSVGEWDYGFLLRNDPNQSNTQLRLVITSERTWTLSNVSGDADNVQIIAKGNLADLDLSENGSNLVRLVFTTTRGWFYLNRRLIAELDLSSRINSGSIYIGTGLETGHELDGYSTGYTGFTIWKLP